MQRAILAARSVDEVKEIRNKATALEKYAKLARNFDAEKRAADIRIRAETQAGKLLREMQKAKGARGTGSNQHRKVRSNGATAPTLKDLGITKDQSSLWQGLAANAKKVEEYLESEPDIPTTFAALKAANPSKAKRIDAKEKVASQPKFDFSDASGRSRESQTVATAIEQMFKPECVGVE